MITEIPTSEEFAQAGIDYLLLAWHQVLSLLSLAEHYAELEKSVDEPGVVDKHWAQATRQLATSGSLIHQGAEFLLKSRVAAVSPYLLLEGSKDWSKKAQEEDSAFITFRTIDAQILPRLHDTVCSSRLDPRFKQLLEAIRQRRNAATHGLLRMVETTAPQMLREILEISHHLVGARRWPRLLHDEAYDDPAPWSDYHGQIPRGLLDTWDGVVGLLKPAECKKHLGFSKRTKAFICPYCHTGDIPPEPPIKLAQFDPDDGTQLYCFVCDEHFKISREACAGCGGDVVDESRCLSCNEDLPSSPPPLPS